MSKKIIIIAGANGSGKTTFAKEFLPNEASCPTFINADLIAAGLSPFSPELASIQAGKLMLAMIDTLVAEEKSFAFETTLSGKGYKRKIPIWRELGYHVKLVFLQLPDVEIAIERVAERVRQGGHNIPEATIRRRFDAGIYNFQHRYKPLVDSWFHFETVDDSPRLIDWTEDAKHMMAALKRAGEAARRIAFQTQTNLVIVRDGKKIIEVPKTPT